FVILVAQQINIQRFEKNPLTLILSIKYFNIASVTSKSAITPSFKGRMASMFPGVRPTMRYAASPTSRTLPARRSIATTAGSFKTMRSEEHTSELQSRFEIVCRLPLDQKNEHGANELGSSTASV